MNVALPVVKKPTGIRRSRSGRWRAAVLIAVHVLILVHVLHWLGAGETLSPLEPSEGMEFFKRGVVNAGLIFFGLMILSTLVLGRWACGWGCHLVAIQDLARWALVRLRIRPVPMRSALLAVVPLVAMIYMFVGPLTYHVLNRIRHGTDLPPAVVELGTSALWETFPPLVPAILTFLTCGVAIIYFLGAKGFCTYACPYGAAFGIADQFAPWRIRVTDACQGCGHCTAVCTSNVRVHEEVRDFGMVVDPGCMKCMDCVSVCPQDALYFGPGRPALVARAKAGGRRAALKQASAKVAVALRQASLRWLVLAAFVVGSFGLFMWYDGEFDPVRITILSALTLVLAAAFRGRSSRVERYRLGEEALLGGFFIIYIFCFRGFLNAVPFLFSLGVAAIGAYLSVQFVRLVYTANLSMLRWPLKRGGALRPAGYAFLLFMLFLGGVSAKGATWQVENHVRPRRSAAAFERGVTAAQAGDVETAAGHFERAIELHPANVEALENLAGMRCAMGRFREGITLYEQALEVRPDDPGTYFFLARAHIEIGEYDAAEARLVRAATLAPESPEIAQLLAGLRAFRRSGGG